MFTEDGWDPNDMMNGSYGGGFWMMAILGLLLVALLGTTIYLVLRGTGLGRTDMGLSAHTSPGSPRDVLDQRLARGEISPEEYSSIRTLLGP